MRPDSEIPGTETGEGDSRCLCLYDDVIDLCSRKYAIQVICHIGHTQPARFGEIQSKLDDVSSSTLADRLEELVAAGILDRRRYDEIPPRVEYRLTGDGEELCALLEPLLQWGAAREASNRTA